MSHASSEGQRWYFLTVTCVYGQNNHPVLFCFSWPEFLNVLQNRNKQSSSSSCCNLGHICKYYLPILSKRKTHQIVFVFLLHPSWPRLWEIKWNSPGAMTALKWNLLTFGCRCSSDDCRPHPLSSFTCVKRQMHTVYYFSRIVKRSNLGVKSLLRIPWNDEYLHVYELLQHSVLQLWEHEMTNQEMVR